MAGVKVEIDRELEKQVLAILSKHGLLRGADLVKELEKGEKSGLCARTHKEIWAKY